MPLDESEPAQPGQGAGPPAGIRKITDARTLRALAHPVRIALIEALILGGALTATEAGERIGESLSALKLFPRGFDQVIPQVLAVFLFYLPLVFPVGTTREGLLFGR